MGKVAVFFPRISKGREILHGFISVDLEQTDLENQP